MRNHTLYFCVFLALAWGNNDFSSAGTDSQYSDTISVLQILYADEFRAADTFSAYSEKAHEEKYYEAESLFSAIEASKLVLLDNIAQLLNDLGSQVYDEDESKPTVATTKYNLKAVLNIDFAGIDTKYPLLIKTMNPEGHQTAIECVKNTRDIAVQHLGLVKEAFSAMKSFLGFGRKSPDEYFVCQICGYTVAVVPRRSCSLCESPKSSYKITTPKWRFDDFIEDSKLLSDDEKDYAKRMFDLIYYQDITITDPAVSSSVFASDVYAKWGLGEQREFSLDEKIYIITLDDTAAMWEIYNGINTNRLDAAQKEY